MCPAFCIKIGAPLRPAGVLAGQQSMHFPRRVLHGRRAGAHVVAVVGLEHRVAVEAGCDRVGQAGCLHQRIGRVPEHVWRDEAQTQRRELRLPPLVERVAAQGHEARATPGVDRRRAARVGARRRDDGEQPVALGHDRGALAHGRLVLRLIHQAVGVGVLPPDHERERADLRAGHEVVGRLGHDVGGGDAERLFHAQPRQAEYQVRLQLAAPYGAERRGRLLNRPRGALRLPALRRGYASPVRPLVDELVLVCRRQHGAQCLLGERRRRRRQHRCLYVAVCELGQRDVTDGGEDVAHHLRVVLPERRRAAGLPPVAVRLPEYPPPVELLECERLAEFRRAAQLRHEARSFCLGVELAALDRAAPAVGAPPPCSPSPSRRPV